MANRDNSVGCKPINEPYGHIRVNYYAAATGAAYYMYQPVDVDANGRVAIATRGSNNLFTGIIVGMADDAFGPPSNDYSGYIPANPASVNSAGLVWLMVADDPNQHFILSTTGTALDAQSANASVCWTYGATTGLTASGICNIFIDGSTVVAVGSTQPFRLIRKIDKVDNEHGAASKWVVQPLYHRYAASIPNPTV